MQDPPRPPDNAPGAPSPRIATGIPGPLPLPFADQTGPDPGIPPTAGAQALAEAPLRFLPGAPVLTAAASQGAAFPPETLGTVIAQRAASGPGTTEISLAPEDLGRLRMQLAPEGDRIRIVLSAELPETLDLLRRSVADFTEDLRRMGFASASFDFAGWGGRPADPPPRAEAPAIGPADRADALVLHITAPRNAGLDLRL